MPKSSKSQKMKSTRVQQSYNLRLICWWRLEMVRSLKNRKF